MKLKEFLYLLGIKPKPVRYGSVVESVDLPDDGRVELARWLHPRAYDPIPDPRHLRNLRRYLRPGDVAIDIGAHAGDSTLPIALAVGATGAVLAFEPNPFVFPTLERTAALNPGKTNIIPLRFAASRSDGAIALQYGERGFCNGGVHEDVSPWVHGSAYEVTVQGIHLHSFLMANYPALLARLRFVKIDAEGHELAILESMDALLASIRPLLQIEFFDQRKSPEGHRARLLHRLVAHGYRVMRMTEAEPELFAEEITAENLFAHRSFDAFCIPSPSPSPSPR